MMRAALSLLVLVGASCGFSRPADVPGTDAAGEDGAVLDAPPAVGFTSFELLASDNAGLTANAVGTITGTGVVLAVPFLTSTTSLVPTFAATGDVTVGGDPQSSGFTAHDFSSPVTYHVENADGASADVPVVVNVAAPTSPDLTAPTSFTTGMKPVSVATADLNGDGKPDLVVAVPFSVAVSVLLDTTPAGALAPTFADRVDLPTAGGPQAVAFADFDHDGRLDIAVACSNGNAVTVLMNQTPPRSSTAVFAAKAVFPLAGGATAIATGDFNLDGRPDIAVISGNAVTVLPGTTAPGATTITFGAAFTFTTDTGPTALAIADLNRDGRPDVATASSSGTVAVLLNTGATGADPRFGSRTSFPAGTGPTALAAADLDGDGAPDLVATDPTGQRLCVLSNRTAPGDTVPSFASELDVPDSTVPGVIAVADLDGDGRPDLVGGARTSPGVSIHLTTSAAGAPAAFSASTAFPIAKTPNGIAVADFNGDGKPDVALTEVGADLVTVLLDVSPFGTALTFGPHKLVSTAQGAESLAVGDLNLDGRPDLATANVNAQSVSVLLDTTAAGATTAAYSRLDLPLGEEPSAVVIADLNADGKPDLAIVTEGSKLILRVNTTAPGATTPTFAATPDITLPFGANRIRVADVDGDGRPDLVVGPTIVLLVNTTTPGAGTLTFSAGSALATGPFVLGDVDGDGKPDLVVGNNLATDKGLDVLVNTTTAGASPSFAAPVLVLAKPFSDAVALGDLDGDGIPDLAAVGQSSVAFARGLGGTSFDAPATVACSPECHDLVIADLDRDGRPDLVAHGSAILRSTSAPGKPLAFVAVAPTTDVGSAPVVTDVNLDGHPDLVFLSSAVDILLAP